MASFDSILLLYDLEHVCVGHESGRHKFWQQGSTKSVASVITPQQSDGVGGAPSRMDTLNKPTYLFFLTGERNEGCCAFLKSLLLFSIL
jgi:hypothetical protein